MHFFGADTSQDSDELSFLISRIRALQKAEEEEKARRAERANERKQLGWSEQNTVLSSALMIARDAWAGDRLVTSEPSPRYIVPSPVI